MNPIPLLFIYVLTHIYALNLAPKIELVGQHIIKDTLLLDSRFTELLLPQGVGGISGADGCISIDLGNNKSLFLWGDSFIGKIEKDIKVPPLKFILGNTATVLDGNRIQQLFQGDKDNPKPLFEVVATQGKTMWYWPGDGVVNRNEILLFMSKFSKKEGASGPFGFQYEGSDILVIDINTYKIKRTIPFLSAEQSIHYGHAVIKEGQDLFVYGSKMDNEHLTSELHVMKIRINKHAITQKLYWDGKRWDTNFNRSKAISGINQLVSEQFSVRKIDHKIVFLTQDRLKVPGEIYSYLGDRPEGPFNEERLIHKIDEPNLQAYKLFTYNAMLHPQIQKDDKLLVSYNINTYDEAIWWKYGSVYRPRFLWVPKKSFGLN